MQITQADVDYLRKQHVHIAIPCYGGQVFECVMIGLLKFVIYANKIGVNFSIDTLVNESLISRGRNSLVAKMMENAAATHLLFIDADIGFQPENIFKLLLDNKDIVVGCYPKKSAPQIDYVMNVDPDNVTPDGSLKVENDLIKITRGGTGFMLIKREVIDKMFSAYPETKYTGNIGLDKKYDPFMYDLFSVGVVNGFLLSEDYMFCDRWAALGGNIYADVSIKLDHIGHYRYPGDPAVLSEKLGKPVQAAVSMAKSGGMQELKKPKLV